MDKLTDQTAQASINDKPPTDAFEPTDQDLENLFMKQQIQTWGYEQIDLWLSQGWDVIVVNGKVIWVK